MRLAELNSTPTSLKNEVEIVGVNYLKKNQQLASLFGVYK